jgi:hypothetical protein
MSLEISYQIEGFTHLRNIILQVSTRGSEFKPTPQKISNALICESGSLDFNASYRKLCYAKTKIANIITL